MMRRSLAVCLIALASLLAASVPVSAGGDTTPPVLHSLAVSPNTVEVSSGAQSVQVSATITDDLSGVQSAEVMLESPSGGQSVHTFLVSTAGDSYSGQFTFPQFAESGLWTVDFFVARDQVGNQLVLYYQDLIAIGMDVGVGVGDFAANSQRSATFRVSRRGTARGEVTLATGEEACVRYVQVELERKTRGVGWRVIASDVTDHEGDYSMRGAADRAGKYRVVATEFTLGEPPIATCETAVSPTIRRT